MSISTLLGLGVLALGAFTARMFQRHFADNRLGREWVLAESAVFVCGVFLGVVALSYSRYPTPDTRLLGLPFVAGAFERSPDGHWADFVGTRTLPATLGNFIVGFILPHIPFAGAAWFAGPRHNAA